MRKALCIGINYYESCSCLNGCAYDAKTVAKVLSVNDDSSVNFETRLLTAEDNSSAITAPQLKYAIKELFKGDPEIALFYYSGHGAVDTEGGFLCTSEIEAPDEGVSLNDVMAIAGKSEARTKIIVLDSCHSGFAGNHEAMPNYSLLPNGTIILSACGEKEYAVERGGHGVFTSLFVQALLGGAMNILGEVSPGSIYSYIDRSLGAWDQRPVFKANIKNFVCIRKNAPSITLDELKQITRFFKYAQHQFPLDPTYESSKLETDNKEVNEEHEADFKLLRKYHSLNLVEPVGETYMYWAAINSKACGLTPLGQHYWRLVRTGKL